MHRLPHCWHTECGPAASVSAARMVHSVSAYLAPLKRMAFTLGSGRNPPQLSRRKVPGDRVVSNVGGSVPLPRALKSEDENRRRHAEIAQRLEREVRSNIPTRVTRGFCTLEGLRMPAAKTGVRRHDSRRQRARFNCPAPPLLSRLSGSAWARQDCPRCARRCAVLTRPARSLEISNYRSAGLVLTGMVFIPTARPDSSA
jgi:hypothetical protein